MIVEELNSNAYVMHDPMPNVSPSAVVPTRDAPSSHRPWSHAWLRDQLRDVMPKRDPNTVSDTMMSLRNLRVPLGMVCRWMPETVDEETGEERPGYWQADKTVEAANAAYAKLPWHEKYKNRSERNRMLSGHKKLLRAQPKPLLSEKDARAAKEQRRLDRNWRKADARRRRQAG